MKENNSMRFKRFGRRTGVPVSELALGTGRFGKTWGDDDEPDEVRSMLQGSVEAGGTYIQAC
jgi:aryl-alcohol dehydrogenase-like predicted oxidoreductase